MCFPVLTGCYGLVSADRAVGDTLWFYLRHSGCLSQQLKLCSYHLASLAVAWWLRTQPGENSVPTATAPAAAAKCSFN